MAVAIQFLRNHSPHHAGEKIGTDSITAEKLIQAGYARSHDLEAEARATAPKPKAKPAKAEPVVATKAKGPDGKGPDGKSPDVT